MISDDERRRAVAELRKASTGAYRHVDALDVIAGSVGVDAEGKFGHEVEKETYAALADLIDPPTCKNASGCVSLLERKKTVRRLRDGAPLRVALANVVRDGASVGEVREALASLIDRPTCEFKPAYKPDAMGKEVRGGCGRMSEFPTEAIGALIGHIRYLERKLHRAELMHRRTAEHLRQERKRRRISERDARQAEELNRVFWGCEGGNSIIKTPEHYRGDGFVTCRRAMESAPAQETVCERPPIALWWWCRALEYVWRMWSKEDPRRDGQKAIDCIRKALAEIGERG